MNIDNLETGDILLFNGNYFLSHLIEYLTDSIYSHIGIIIINPNFENKILEGIYVLESGYESKPDIENNRIKYGVQLTKLDDIIKNYDGKLFVRKLICKRNREFYNKIIQIHSDVHNLPYDLNALDWIKAYFNVEIGDVKRKNEFWCSALVCYVYIKLGFLDENIPWTIIRPQDFSSKSRRFIFRKCKLEEDRLLIYSEN